MAETVQAIEAIEDIAAVPGIDGVFVGPSDPALTEGLTPDLRCAEPEHVRRIERVAAACQAAGITAGIYAGAADTAKLWRGRGYRMLATHADAMLLRLGAQTLLAELHDLYRLRAEERFATGSASRLASRWLTRQSATPSTNGSFPDRWCEP